MHKIGLGKAKEIVKIKVYNKLKRPSMFLGQAGIGKTAMFEDLAKKELKIGYKDIRLSQYSGVDAKGIPVPDLEKGITRWLIDGMLPREEFDGSEGILVLDECTSIEDPTVQTMLYQLTNERRIGNEYIMPEGWIIVLLGNRQEDGGDYYGLLAPLRDRCDIYEVTFDVNIWIDWAMRNGVNSFITSYLKENPSVTHTYNPELEGDIEGMIFATPRSWVGASDILNLKNVEMDIKLDMLRGVLPRNVISDFIDYYVIGEKLPNVSDIFEGKVRKEDIDKEVRESCGFLLYTMLCTNLVQVYNEHKTELDQDITEETQEIYDNFHNMINNTILFICDYDIPLIQALLTFIRNCEFSPIALEVIIDSPKFSEYVNKLNGILEKLNS